MQIEGSTALVTGGASGLGLATATALHQAGARVVLVDLPTSKGAEAAESLGDGARFVAADVTSDTDVREAVDIAAADGSLRIAVNCAGVGTPGKILGREGVLPLADFERVVRINLFGTFNVLRLAAEAMSRNEPVGGAAQDGGGEGAGAEAGTPERGVIVDTASVAAFDGQIGQPAYAASKGAVAALTLPAARELSRHLIRVMTIAPGIFDTPMMASLPEAARASLGAQVPHPSRLGRPEEYAALVKHIVENPMLNGETIRLDGAIRMQPK
ncbi:3-hydroxyacyl-CoA dehydrogenase [Microbacterium sp. STN6]|uniref:3-hydroxyacyl-CoA dehydrogenase n=1 Tax=Microbacterium sp. STN6 TaxID=2995588 RepID=UPI002260C5D2|nr:3-hydroxyacyl-CoA dehydrogenase [Microbacterium sp. STN6]MCX7520941.1 3-hydroxyacyl-CoA dehydrogenase [Microbacterium sp. STN6]